MCLGNNDFSGNIKDISVDYQYPLQPATQEIPISKETSVVEYITGNKKFSNQKLNNVLSRLPL